MAAHIDPAFILRLQKALGVSRREVYRRIQRIVNTFHIDLRPAALMLASQHGVNTARFGTPEDRVTLREALRGVASSPVSLNDASSSPVPLNDQGRRLSPTVRTEARSGRTSAARRRGGRRADTSVWLVHGRDTKAANELRKFLRALGLNPLEWNQGLARAREGSPYVGTVLDQNVGKGAATVVLLTPDDEAQLRTPFRTATDPSYERRLTPQPRLNVIWEGGMAFARNPRASVLVQIGEVRPFSNITGRHIVHLTGSAESRRELATKLKAAGCAVDTDGTDWLSHGDFTQPEPRARRRRRRARRPGKGRSGTRLVLETSASVRPPDHADRSRSRA